MSRLALLNPTTLLGNELREALEGRPELWQELLLLATDPEGAGALTELRGTPALVAAYEEGSLEGVDVAVCCAPAGAGEVPRGVPPATKLIVAWPTEPMPAAVPVVAGVNLDRAGGGAVLISPAPAVVALAHLLHPLRRHGLEETVALLVQPASMHGKQGMDELFEQTRSILSFSSRRPKSVFGRQLAFNLLPSAAAGDHLPAQLQEVLAAPRPAALHLVQGSAFHCLAAGVFVRLGEDPGPEGVRESLAEHPYLRLAEEPELLGPIDAAASEEVLVGAVRQAPGRPGGYWLWAVMDNLTRGGALNCLELIEAVLGSSGAS